MKRLILPFLILGLCACSNTPAPSPLDGVNKKLDNICQKLDEEKVSKEAKDAFYEYLSEISLSRDPYTIITVSFRKTEAKTFDYEYIVADVYYTVGYVIYRQYIFAWDSVNLKIVQITEPSL